MIVVDQEEIIEIASHFLGGIHGCIDIKFIPLGEGREDPGQHIGLDLGRDGQLRSDPFFLGRHFLQEFHIIPQLDDHIGKLVGKGSEFIRSALFFPDLIGDLHILGIGVFPDRALQADDALQYRLPHKIGKDQDTDEQDDDHRDRLLDHGFQNGGIHKID